MRLLPENDNTGYLRRTSELFLRALYILPGEENPAVFFVPSGKEITETVTVF